MEKKQYLKLFLTWIIVFSMIALFFVWGTENQYKSAVVSLMAVWMMTLVAVVEMGPAMLFSTMKGKYDMQSLLLLPSSNLEKYLLRYSKWIVMLIFIFISLLIADGVQYVSKLIAGHGDAHSVTAFVMTTLAAQPIVMERFTMWILMIFVHSLYAVGGTFFRSRNYAWLCVSFTLVAVALLVVAIFKQLTYLDGQDVIKVFESPVTYVILAVLSVFNFWLSYRLFCRIQLKGRFINI